MLDEEEPSFPRAARWPGMPGADVFDDAEYVAVVRANVLVDAQGRKRVIQRRFNVGVLEAIPERKASTL